MPSSGDGVQGGFAGRPHPAAAGFPTPIRGRLATSQPHQRRFHKVYNETYVGGRGGAKAFGRGVFGAFSGRTWSKK